MDFNEIHILCPLHISLYDEPFFKYFILFTVNIMQNGGYGALVHTIFIRIC